MRTLSFLGSYTRCRRDRSARAAWANRQRDIDQVVEIGFELEVFEDGDRRFGLGDDEVLAHVGGSFANLAAEPLFQIAREVAFPRGGAMVAGGLGGGGAVWEATVLAAVRRPPPQRGEALRSPPAFARRPFGFL